MLKADELDDETWDDLETLLIQADVGGETSAKLVERMRKHVQALGIKHTSGTRRRSLSDWIRVTR